MPKIQIKRGSKAKLPTLAPGSSGWRQTPGSSTSAARVKPAYPGSGRRREAAPSELPPMDYDPAGSAAAVQKALTAHTGNKNNPHAVTAEQVGPPARSRAPTPSQRARTSRRATWWMWWKEGAEERHAGGKCGDGV